MAVPLTTLIGEAKAVAPDHFRAVHDEPPRFFSQKARSTIGQLEILQLEMFESDYETTTLCVSHCLMIDAFLLTKETSELRLHTNHHHPNPDMLLRLEVAVSATRTAQNGGKVATGQFSQALEGRYRDTRRELVAKRLRWSRSFGHRHPKMVQGYSMAISRWFSVFVNLRHIQASSHVFRSYSFSDFHTMSRRIMARWTAKLP